MPDVQKLGPQVGTKVPEFSLPDQTGQIRTLASVMGSKGAMLVFYRSADWCPYCKTQLVELQGRLEDLQRAGLGVAAISYDPVPVLGDFAKRRGITFPLLSDAGSALIKTYGILNTTVPPTNQNQYGIPFPGTFVVDRRAQVTSRFFETAYQERDTTSSILVRLGNSVDVPGTKVGGAHVEMTTYVTDQTVAPGTHFSVVLDVTPAARVHVYAPGVTGYKPLSLVIKPQAGLIVRDAQFPKPEDFHFKPLDEHVLVYQKPFRVVQDLMIDASPQAQSVVTPGTAFTIDGVLSYQACDDRECFLPQQVPLTWTVTTRGLDRERSNAR